MANYNRSSLILSVGRALLGEVSPMMRVVMARFGHGGLDIHILVDGEAGDEDRQAARRVGLLVAKDFVELKIRPEIIRLDAPAEIPHDAQWALVFKRRE